MADLVYWTVFAIAVSVVAAPLLVRRRDGPALTLRNIGLATILIVPLTAALAFTMSDNELRLDGDRIVLHAAHFYQAERPLAEFDLARARSGRYDAIPEARLGVRTNGIGLPGYAAGWYTARDGGAIVVLLTDRERVVYLPARSGPALLISVEQPERFLAALRAAQTGR
ncbi:hypothetical protein ASF77_07720 [Massilia sp. Leaf139]|nr:hypothetical protein ASF77_07720 [Massilia sp. Leaf139]